MEFSTYLLIVILSCPCSGNLIITDVNHVAAEHNHPFSWLSICLWSLWPTYSSPPSPFFTNCSLQSFLQCQLLKVWLHGWVYRYPLSYIRLFYIDFRRIYQFWPGTKKWYTAAKSTLMWELQDNALKRKDRRTRGLVSDSSVQISCKCFVRVINFVVLFFLRAPLQTREWARQFRLLLYTTAKISRIYGLIEGL